MVPDQTAHRLAAPISSQRAKSVINVVSFVQVTVMSPMDGSLSYAGQTSADSVQMNPSEPLIALKGKKKTLLIWGYIIKVRKVAKIGNGYNQLPHLTQDTTWESDKNTIKHHKREGRGQQARTGLKIT